MEPALRVMDRCDREVAQTFRLCMGWGNIDEESVFTDWLQGRMRHAIAVLNLCKF